MRVVVVSTNAGSACEKGGDLLLPRLSAALKSLVVVGDFVAIHLQELAGKDKRIATVTGVEDAIRVVFARDEWLDTGLLFNADVGNEFTALGCIYFVRRSMVPRVQVLHRRLGAFVSLEQLVGERAALRFSSVVKTRKFNAVENPDGGRKGFLQVVFSLSGQRVGFVNVHLPADTDNRVSVAASPSQYANLRKRVLDVSLEECAEDSLLIAGDFNFRLDAKQLLEDTRAQGDSVDAKSFNSAFASANSVGSTRLLQWDRELLPYERVLHEMPIKFAPTYCMSASGAFDQKRCPAWPDRVLFTASLKRFIGPESRQYQSRPWGADHELVSFACQLEAAVPLSAVMHHPQDEVLDRNGELSGPPSRRRRGVLSVRQLIPLVAVGAGALVVGYLLYSTYFRRSH
jgi:hypothetical protein